MAHPDRLRLPWEGHGSAAARGYGSAWRDRRKAQLARKPWCACGSRATEVDHLIPKAEGGTDHERNLVSRCTPCHQAKSSSEGGRAAARSRRDRHYIPTRKGVGGPRS
jgi:5-methylcytosine-specific restriction protein A